MFLHGGPSCAARRRMNPVATDTKPAEAGYHGYEPASAGFVLPAAGFSPPACGPAAGRERYIQSHFYHQKAWGAVSEPRPTLALNDAAA